VNSVDAGWDGSLNEPWIGEKGMLTEGGIRVPFLLRWKGTLPEGLRYKHPVISLDVAATALAAAGLARPAQLDGVDLLPYLTNAIDEPPHENLYWRFWSQAAVRSGRWKFLTVAGEADFLFDMRSDAHERRNLVDTHPRLAVKLRQQLEQWTNELQPAGIPTTAVNDQEVAWYRHHLGVDVSQSFTTEDRQAQATTAR
jgi:arylsulfatase A-like enzyme